MTITNGTVEYERVTRPAEFESKRAKATLFFVVDDDVPYTITLQGAMDAAQARVHVTLGLPAVPPVGVTEASLQRESAEAAPRGARRGRPPAAATVASVPVVEPETAASDPFGETGTVTDAAPLATAVIVEEHLHRAAALTDDGLRTALEAKVASVSDGEREALTVRIRELIGSIHGDPKKSVYAFTKEQRSAFLDRLAELK